MSPASIILYSLLVATLAVCYHAQLIRAGHLLCTPHNWLEAGERFLRGFSYRNRFLFRVYQAYCWITKSTRECAWCLAGQLAVAHYLLRFGWPHGTGWLDLILHTGAAIAMATYIMKKTLHVIQST